MTVLRDRTRGVQEMAENVACRKPSERKPAPSSRPTAVDGLVVGGREVWVLVAGPDEDPADLLWSDDLGCDSLKICKAVLDDDTLVLGDADPEQDPLLSDILRGARGETAQ